MFTNSTVLVEVGIKKDNRPLLDQAADDTQRIVNGALRFLDHQLVGASHHDAHRLPGTGAAGDLHRITKSRSVRGLRASSGLRTANGSLRRTFTSFPEPSRLTSSASSAVPSISAVKWSMWAMGLVPMVWKGGEGLMEWDGGVVRKVHRLETISSSYY